MQIIIRMDDITPDMSWEKFGRVRAILDKYNISPLIGVVPDCKDKGLHYDEAREDFYDTIRELAGRGWNIAQHGTFHCYVTEERGLLGINPFSEYAGLDYETQYEKIKAGQAILEKNGIKTDIFMAPGHTYDENTLKALKELGFVALTDGLYYEAYVREGIICVPCRLAALKDINGLDTLCLHSNLMKDEEFDELEAFIASHVNEIISFRSVIAKGDAVQYSAAVEKVEKKVLAKRLSRNRIAESERLAWYLSYTNHSNSKVKWLKRAVMLPLLLTNKYKGN